MMSKADIISTLGGMLKSNNTYIRSSSANTLLAFAKYGKALCL
jgi:hypothetical protein